MIRTFYALLTLLCIISIAGCKKSDPSSSEPEIIQDPIPGEVKSIEVIRGNHQFAYKGSPMDTIILKVKLNVSGDGSALEYYIRGKDYFVTHSKEKSGDEIIIKGFWHPLSDTEEPSTTLYFSASCSYNEMARQTCKKMDSVVLFARFKQRWKTAYEVPGGPLNDFKFIDEDNGIAIGEGSGVVRTADGGKTWVKAAPVRSDNSAHIISFAGRDTALVSTVNNYASFTNDGGKTFFQADRWTPPFTGHQSSTSYYLQNRNIIYSVGYRGNIAKTIDGGYTWDKSGSFNILNSLNDLTNVGTDTLFTCGSVGFIARTSDAGKTWKQQYVQLNNDLTKIYFVNSSLGFVGGRNGTLLRTTDGGEHWETISSGAYSTIIAIRFFKNGHGILVSTGGEISESKNNGISWSPIMKSNYGAGDLNKAIIKDEHTIFGLERASILTYSLSKP